MDVGFSVVILDYATVIPGNVWSAARLQGKSEGPIDRSAQMYSAFEWRVESPGHDELRCVLFLINGTVMEDHFREQVLSTLLGTVQSSWLSSADLGGNSKSSSPWCGKVGARFCASKPKAPFLRLFRRASRLSANGTRDRSIVPPRRHGPACLLRL
jgi:hypothetical protein